MYRWLSKIMHVNKVKALGIAGPNHLFNQVDSNCTNGMAMVEILDN